MTVRGLAQRIDFNLGRILVLVHLVEVDEDIGSLGLSTLSLEAKLLRNTESLLLAQALLEVNRRGDDSIGILGGNLLDVHTTLRRCNEYWTTDSTVVEDSDVVLVSGIAAFSEHDL